MPVELALLRILHQHLRCLADSGEQLVCRLRCENELIFRPRPGAAHRVVLAVEGVESGVRQPGFVEMQRIDVAVERMLDRLGVVEHAVVGALRQRQDARLDLARVDVLQQRVRCDLAADRLGRELGLRDRPDDAVLIARRRQEHRHSAGHDDRVQDRLVAVAVDHHHVARRHRVVPHHLVGGAGAVGDEEAVVGVEDARGVALGVRHRAGVVRPV